MPPPRAGVMLVTVTPLRRLVMPMSAVALGLCLSLWGLSLWRSSAVLWGRESVALTRGVAVFYRSRATPKPLSFIHVPTSRAGRGGIPGERLAGFHFLRDTSGGRTSVLVGVPMWFPTALSAAGLGLALRPRRGAAAAQGFAVDASGDPGTPGVTGSPIPPSRHRSNM